MFAAFVASLHSALSGLTLETSHLRAEMQDHAHALMAEAGTAQQVVTNALRSELFAVGESVVDVRMMVMISTGLWATLFSLFWMMPSLVRLQSKKTVETMGVVGAQVETVDRLVAVIHAVVATTFGSICWVYFYANGVGGLCHVPAEPSFYRAAMRTGTAVTLGFIIYDLAIILVVDVFNGVRPIAPDMMLHHFVIITLATWALSPGNLGTDVMLWFFAANLLNEFSTVFLHLCKFAKECGYDKDPVFKVLGGGLVFTFFFFRCVCIATTLALLRLTHACGLPAAKAYGMIYPGTGVHLLLNCWWFYKIMALILKASKPREAGSSPRPEEEAAEAAPLLGDADASGLSTDVAE